MTLISKRPPLRAVEAGAAFATPTVVHFTVTLSLSALVRVPWHSTAALVASCVLVGLGGAGYMILVARRMRAQSRYNPEFEDWIFHLLLPLAGYMLFIVAALVMRTHLGAGLLVVAAAVLLLTRNHNAWDAVAYHVLSHKRADRCTHLSD